MRLIDLTQEIYEGMPVYKGHLETKVWQHHTFEDTAPNFDSEFAYQSLGITFTRGRTWRPNSHLALEMAMYAEHLRVEHGPLEEALYRAHFEDCVVGVVEHERRLIAVEDVDAQLDDRVEHVLEVVLRHHHAAHVHERVEARGVFLRALFLGAAALLELALESVQVALLVRETR